MDRVSTSGQVLRDKYPDILRGVAVILMIQIHITEVFATDSFREGFFGQLSLFLGGVPAAPVFMVLMGWYAVSRLEVVPLMLRGLMVFFAGLLLNVGLNFTLLLSVFSGYSSVDVFPYIFGVDVFSLAGISLMFIALIRFIAVKLSFLMNPISLVKWVVTFLPVLIVGGGMLWSSHPKEKIDVFSFISAFVWRDNQWWSYFPVFPWMAWPLLGGAARMWFGKEGFPEIKREVVIMAALGTVVGALLGWRVSTDLTEYYQFDLFWFVWAICVMIVWFWLWRRLSGVEWLANSLSSVGSKVTSLYVIQWLLIGNLGTFLYHEQPDRSIPFWMALILFLTLFIRSLPDRVEKWREKDWL